MHFARLSKSDRLQRTLAVLKAAGGEISTYDLSRKAGVCAVNSIIAELRENGAVIECRQQVVAGDRRFFYELKQAPKEEENDASN